MIEVDAQGNRKKADYGTLGKIETFVGVTFDTAYRGTLAVESSAVVRGTLTGLSSFTGLGFIGAGIVTGAVDKGYYGAFRETFAGVGRTS